jgi:hypothetical protein
VLLPGSALIKSVTVLSERCCLFGNDVDLSVDYFLFLYVVLGHIIPISGYVFGLLCSIHWLYHALSSVRDVTVRVHGTDNVLQLSLC